MLPNTRWKTAGGAMVTGLLMWLPRGSLSIHPSGRKCATINKELGSPRETRDIKRDLPPPHLYL